MKFVVFSFVFVGGYAASIYTWEKVKEIVLGAEHEAEKAYNKYKELRGKAGL